MEINKIIGFTISRKKIDHSDIDIFKSGLSRVYFHRNEFHIYMWGIGTFENVKDKKTVSLSFPKHYSLLDRNVLIHFQENNVIEIENDWLSSIPVFYNPEKQIVSTLPAKCLTNKNISTDGLANYLEFGYSILGQTAFEQVKFMRAFSKLAISETLTETAKRNDPALDFLSLNQDKDNVNEIMESHKSYLAQIETQYNLPKIIPTSGGYDSRLLNIWTLDKSNTFSYTYGISKKQSASKEVVYAKKLSEILKTNWQQIPLNNYMRYMNEAFHLYGFSTHFQSMYHIDFYTKIKQHFPKKHSLWYSGIFGDIWAGHVETAIPKHANELSLLGYSHGLNIDIKNDNNPLKEAFFKKNKTNLQSEAFRLVTIIRLKIILISFLTSLPEYFGFPVVTPFLNFELVKKQLLLKPEFRKNRKWQQLYFKQTNCDIEKFKLKYSRQNFVNFEAALNHTWPYLNNYPFNDGKIKQKVQLINKILKEKPAKYSIQNKLMTTMYLKEVLRHMGMKNNFLNLVTQYQVLKPIEMGFEFISDLEKNTTL